MAECLDKVQMKLRMPESLRAKIEASAKVKGLSLNAELVRRLEQSFQDDQLFALVVQVGRLEDNLARLERRGA